MSLQRQVIYLCGHQIGVIPGPYWNTAQFSCWHSAFSYISSFESLFAASLRSIYEILTLILSCQPVSRSAIMLVKHKILTRPSMNLCVCVHMRVGTDQMNFPNRNEVKCCWFIHSSPPKSRHDFCFFTKKKNGRCIARTPAAAPVWVCWRWCHAAFYFFLISRHKAAVASASLKGTCWFHLGHRKAVKEATGVYSSALVWVFLQASVCP